MTIREELSKNYWVGFLTKQGKQDFATAGYKQVILVHGKTLLPDAFEITERHGYEFLHALPSGTTIHAFFGKGRIDSS